MRFLADEDTHAGIVAWLRDSGHDVAYAAEDDRSARDEQLLERASREGRILITADRDFGELVFHRRLATRGIVLLRLAGLSLQRRLELLRARWAAVEAQARDRFIVISRGKVRIRPLTPQGEQKRAD